MEKISSEPEITVRHRTFSEHLWHLSEQKSICSAKLSEHRMHTRSLGARLARGYTASKRQSQYPVMKRNRWYCQTVMWLYCETVS